MNPNTFSTKAGEAELASKSKQVGDGVGYSNWGSWKVKFNENPGFRRKSARAFDLASGKITLGH